MDITQCLWEELIVNWQIGVEEVLELGCLLVNWSLTLLIVVHGIEVLHRMVDTDVLLSCVRSPLDAVNDLNPVPAIDLDAMS